MKNVIKSFISILSLAAAFSTVQSAIAADNVVTSFDASKNQLPEGLVVSGETLYVGMANSSEVWKVALDGSSTLFGSAPAAVAGKGFLTGLAVAGNGDVLAALASFAPEVQPGIYRIPKSGGKAVLFAKHKDMVFPNDLKFDRKGNLLVTDSTGSIFRISPKGEATLLVRDEKLKGDKTGASSSWAPGAKFGMDIGANGLALSNEGTVFIANSDKGTILKFQFNEKTGKAGPLEVHAQDSAILGGADGIALTDKGDIIVTSNTRDKLLRVSPTGKITELKVSSALDFPASISISGKSAYVTNAGFLSQSKKPSVVKIGLD